MMAEILLLCPASFFEDGWYMTAKRQDKPELKDYVFVRTRSTNPPMDEYVHKTIFERYKRHIGKGS